MLSSNPFDDEQGSFFALINDEDSTRCGLRSPPCQTDGPWLWETLPVA